MGFQRTDECIAYKDLYRPKGRKIREVADGAVCRVSELVRMFSSNRAS